MRIALFVEGSTGEFDRSGNDIFLELWKVGIVAALGLREIHHVYPISKKHIIALDPKNPKMSGASESLDFYMTRKLATEPFDAAVVAWDLHPTWESASVRACRWKETLEFYRLLAQSTALPAPWVDWAGAKARELQGRTRPSDRPEQPKLCPYGTFAVCMEPVFEALLLGSEAGIKRALGVEGVRVPGWPNWDLSQPRPELSVLQKAIISAKGLVPKKKNAHVVGGDMRTAKHAWAKRLIAQLAEDPTAREALHGQPIARRLVELLAQVPSRKHRR